MLSPTLEAIPRTIGRPMLGLLFGILYVVLYMESLSLLVGTVALFVALSVVRFVTRRLDWSRQRPGTVWKAQ
jgi:inner membrane protein